MAPQVGLAVLHLEDVNVYVINVYTLISSYAMHIDAIIHAHHAITQVHHVLTCMMHHI